MAHGQIKSVWMAAGILVLAACGSKGALRTVLDGAAPAGSGGRTSSEGGGGGAGRGGTMGTGGALGTGGAVGTGGAAGVGGSTATGRTDTGGSGRGGSGIAGASAGGSGSGGSSGTGGAGKDAGAPDVPSDLGAGGDARILVDGSDGCGPGYPLGSSRLAADGCNSCVCNAGGIWACTLLYCPPSDAAGVDKPADGAVHARDAASDGGQGTCSEEKTAAACDARSDCHSLFMDSNLCNCAEPGCCMIFERCTDRAQADCRGPAMCKMMPPTCGTDYVVAYLETCYEGCVHPTDCAP
jgi:hypothetical protein